VTLAVYPGRFLVPAHRSLVKQMAVTDRACNRFHPASELSRLNDAGGRPVGVSPTLFEALVQAVRAAEITGGAVDPTIGTALVALGYDRDIDEVVSAGGPGLFEVPRPAAGCSAIELDAVHRRVRLRRDVRIDLGATAKAQCVDRAVHRIATETGAGALVSIGGDVGVAGPAPPDGWSVAVTDNARAATPAAGCVVAIREGGLASSSTAARSWCRSGYELHHIVDPSTGWPADPIWRLVSVAAASCLDANIASTASVIWGADAPQQLASHGLPARLVHRDGHVATLGAWPAELDQSIVGQDM
jgi:FAD:protein FMN transferase